MRARIIASAIAALCLAGLMPVAGQTKTLPYDHIHLNVPDPRPRRTGTRNTSVANASPRRRID